MRSQCGISTPMAAAPAAAEGEEHGDAHHVQDDDVLRGQGVDEVERHIGDGDPEEGPGEGERGAEPEHGEDGGRGEGDSRRGRPEAMGRKRLVGCWRSFSASTVPLIR